VDRTIVILITGHPATGKTTLAHYLAEELSLPLIWKDQIKETLFETLGVSTIEWSRTLGVAAWELLYQQVENLLRVGVSHVVESNFDPAYADEHWQNLKREHDFRLIQVRCETEPETLLERYCRRIEQGGRHAGHVDARGDESFLATIQESMGWVTVESQRVSIDTTEFGQIDYREIAQTIKDLIR